MKGFVSIKGLADNIQAKLNNFNDALVKLGTDENGIIGELLSNAPMNSGNGIRPKLVILGSSLGEPKQDHVLSLSLAVELIHIATLIHDNIIDNEELRQARNTIASRHGTDMAVLLGDYLYTLAFNQIIQTNNNEVLKIMVHTTSVICKGELEQSIIKNNFALSEEDYFSSIERKTASFFGASIRLGALIADQNREIQDSLENYGKNLGMAFQIKEDLLDLIGDEKVMIETLRTDLLNGKMTLPLINYRNKMDSPKDFERLIDSIKESDGHILILINQVKEAGSIRYAEGIAENYIQKAKDCLESLPQGEPRDQMIKLADNSQKSMY